MNYLITEEKKETLFLVFSVITLILFAGIFLYVFYELYKMDIRGEIFFFQIILFIFDTILSFLIAFVIVIPFIIMINIFLVNEEYRLPHKIIALLLFILYFPMVYSLYRYITINEKMICFDFKHIVAFSIASLVTQVIIALAGGVLFNMFATKSQLFDYSDAYIAVKEPKYIELRELQDKVLLYFADAFHNFNWNNPLNLEQEKIKTLSEQIQIIATAVRMLSSYNPQIDLIKVTENEYSQIINFLDNDLRQITEKMQPLEEEKAREFLNFISDIVHKQRKRQ